MSEHSSKRIRIVGRNIDISPNGTIVAIGYVSSYLSRRVSSKTLGQHLGAKNGYRYVHIFGPDGNEVHLVHRLVAKAFLPDFSNHLDVDHINGNRSDNRIENLRMATRSDNLKGKRINVGRSKYRGVSLCKQTGKWRAKCKSDYKYFCGGRHDSEEAAALAFNALATRLGFKPEALNHVQ